MSEKQPFSFSQFVPGFDFLKNLAAGSGNDPATGKPSIPGLSGIPNIPGVSNWIAPTLSVEEVDKRIKELKTVQFWLEQNLYALKATIQALEVQKMTLSTLRGMNLRMEDLANVFTSAATGASAKTAEAKPEPEKEKEKPRSRFAQPEPEPEVEETEEEDEAEDEAQAGNDSASTAKGGDKGGGVVDPMQWWGALTQQFQEIAGSALSEAANLKMPTALTPKAAKKAAPARKKAPAAKKASATRKRAARPARKR
ncbi:hypothetical protein QTI66_26660 [Variovorax sp. J22R133]|uniref:PhaM family polyhydroxyalkanoate granule multifunctional regulatory protein n=1 Tax=Variovorax brevis TaxID=3053503 RepID=UPI002575042A|nr:PhaM family polyhydroxyalkanoate granule multifunctional regulatory protein [Variovorax sp. J22R133]MDM0115759.1 hypothetical protein [Variovorax sp. J22R133]